MVEAEAMKVRKLILGVAVAVLPLTGLMAASGPGIAGASPIGAGTVSCDLSGTVTFKVPLSTGNPRKRDPAKITVNASESSCSSGVSITKGTGRFVISGFNDSPCFQEGGGWGSLFTFNLHFAHLRSSVVKGGIGGDQTGGASNLTGGGPVTGSYASSDTDLTGLMNDLACNTGITSTGFSVHLSNF
jgi:hypothetical protein